ncbi:hypothetical protein KI688_010202 [Linnemannia hyalina]|uniref:DNA polymerase delta subunit 4 n=1 Tax=Linnemannia hyalina TaxID=64524 RepID=A0A9P7XZ31_9FUNG|nr:hypothetical protein KI688_010202 [Linnemannia hyalina]
MAPKKPTSSVAAAASPASAADFFTRGKKPTTTDRVINVKKTTTATVFKHTPALKSSSTNNKPRAQSQQIKQDQNKPHDIIVISDSEDDEKASSISRDEVNNDDDAAWGFGEDLGPLDDFLFDDAIEPQEPQNKPLPQTKLKKDIAEPLITPVMSRSSSAKRSRSHLVSTRSVNIQQGIHQEDISEHEKILRQFDLASKYGPCLGMTRLERWERASLLGLSPPVGVKDLAVKNTTLNTPIYAGRV